MGYWAGNWESWVLILDFASNMLGQLGNVIVSLTFQFSYLIDDRESTGADKLLTRGVLPLPADIKWPDTEQTCSSASASLTLLLSQTEGTPGQSMPTQCDTGTSAMYFFSLLHLLIPSSLENWIKSLKK